VSKWRLLTGAVDAGSWVAAGALLASAVLNIGYFAPIVLRAFEPAAPGTPSGVHEASPAMLVPLLCTAAAGLALGLVPDAGPRLLSLASAAAAAVTGTR
jgi:multicomponent Na+:H+ antiporter subunit D